jgi:general secretion pathway protein J
MNVPLSTCNGVVPADAAAPVAARGARSYRPVRGFTLVEVLVATSLLALLALGLASAMRSMGQTETRLDQRLQAADEMRVATQFLRSVLGRVSVRRSSAPTQAGASVHLFAAAPDAVAWIGVMPARHGAGGRHFFRLGLEPVDGAMALVLRFVPWNGVALFPDWSGAQSRVLVARVARLQIEYGAEGPAGLAWQPTWTEPQKVPERVRLSIGLPAADWPPLTIALRPLPLGDGGRGGFVFGPE